MSVNTDRAFYIGVTHDVCQDYALSGSNKIVIADGCSGSPLTDFGSRVLSITAINKMAELEKEGKILQDFQAEEVILLARPSIKMMNLPLESLDSTLLCANATLIKDNKVEGGTAVCYGDGVIAIKLKNGSTIVINSEYRDNFPYYINYLYDPTGRFKNWNDDHNKQRTTVSIIREDGAVEVLFDNDSEDETGVRIRDGVDIGFLHIQKTRIVLDIHSPGDVDVLSIMSDGVHSFYEIITTETSRHNKTISYIDVLKELLPFKSYNGKFVQRRINKFRKTCAKKNWHNADDVSLAAIYVGE